MSQNIDTRTKLLTQSPFKLMWTLSLPAIIGMVVIGLYNFMDSVFVGQLISPEAMGAVSIAYPFTCINSGIATLVGVGSASVLSRAIGKKDQKTVDSIMGNLIFLILAFSVITTVVGIIFAKQLLLLSGAEGEMLDMATRYLRIIFTTSIFVNLAQSANMVLRGAGLLKHSMAIMAIGAVLNIALDPLMITIFKASGKGIEGAAFATIISQFIQCLITIWYFMKKSKVVKIHKISPSKTLIPQVLSVGVSAMLMQVMYIIQQTLTYNVAGNYGGESWQIILGAVLRISAFSFIPLWGISQGFQPAVGTNYGAKDFTRVKQITKVFALSATVLALLFYIPTMLFPKSILSMFITDPAIAAKGALGLKILFSTYITYGVMIIAITLFQSLGKGSIAAVLSISRQILLFVPLVLLLPSIGNLGVTGIFLAQVITDIVIVLISVIFMLIEFKKMGNTKKEIPIGDEIPINETPLEAN